MIEVKGHKFGIREIAKVNSIAEVKEADLESGTKEDRQREIITCLKKPVAIFPESEEEIALFMPMPRWFRRHTRCLKLLPPLLEERLIAEDDARFGATDRDVRQLVEKTAEVFQANITGYTARKNKIQFATLAFFEGFAIAILAAAAYFRAAAGTLSGTVLAFIFGAAILVWLLVGVGLLTWFNTAIEDAFDNVYLKALKNTAFKVSEFVSMRLNSLSNRFEEYVGKIDSLLPRGEKVERKDSNGKDSALKDGKVFLWMQMLMWLPARVERIETLLRYKMSVLTAVHAEVDYMGFKRTARTFAVFSAIPLLALADGLFAMTRHGAVTLAVVECAVAVIALLFAGYISQRAYYKKEWNTPKHVFREYLDTRLWYVSHKYNLSTRIPARVEKAFAEISHKDGQIGKTQG